MANNQDDFSLQAFMNAASQQQKLADSTTKALTNIATQSQDLTDELVSAIMGGTDRNGDTQLSLETKKLGELEAQNKRADFYSNLANGEGYDKLATRLSNEYATATAESLQIADSLKQRKSVGLLDNPLAYIWNQFIIPDEEQQLHAADTKAKVASDALGKFNDLVQGVGANIEKFRKTTSAAAIESQAKGLSSELRQQAINAELRANQLNAQNVTTILEVSGAGLRNISQVLEMRRSQQMLAMQQEAHAQSTARFKEWEEDTRSKKEFEAEWLDNINRGAKEAGLPQVDSARILSMLRSGQQLPQQIQKLAELGYVNKETRLGGVLGTTPAAVSDTVVKLNIPVPDKTAALFNEAAALVKAEALAPGAKKLSAAEAEAAFNSAVKQLSKKYATEIDPRDKSNPNALPTVKDLAAASPGFRDSKYYQTVLAVMGDKVVDTSDPEILTDLGIQAYQQGKLSLTDISEGLVEYATRARELVNATNQYRKFGVPELESVQVRLKKSDFLGGLFAGKSKVRMDDFTDYSEFLLERLNKMRNSPNKYRIAIKPAAGEGE